MEAVILLNLMSVFYFAFMLLSKPSFVPFYFFSFFRSGIERFLGPVHGLSVPKVFAGIIHISFKLSVVAVKEFSNTPLCTKLINNTRQFCSWYWSFKLHLCPAVTGRSEEAEGTQSKHAWMDNFFANLQTAASPDTSCDSDIQRGLK